MSLSTEIPTGSGLVPGGAASVIASRVGHVFDNGFRALSPTNLHVDAGSFCTLLGPSGSGKTTLLRIFAGLLRPSEGRVSIGGRDVTDEAIQKRDIGFVFQHYALFPHMTVAQNIAYPLRIRGVDKKERDERVDSTLELIGLAGNRDRRPDQLSGGQQQRVAIGRALVYGPKVLLLDEPLGALDRRLRQQLGTDLRRIQQEAGTTAIYVTHDQEEAFLLSDDVVVMDHGDVRQKGKPEAVYNSPEDVFVANFLGDTNMIEGVAHLSSGRSALDYGGQLIPCRSTSQTVDAMPAAFSVRPEDVEVLPPDALSDGLFVFGEGIVEDRVFMGAHHRLRIRVSERVIIAETAQEAFHPEAGARVQVAWKSDRPVLMPIGDQH